MRFSEAWLREWVNPAVDTATLADQLSMAGLEVDALIPAAPAFTGVRIGRVQSVEPHPDAAKLRVCRVDLGQGEPQQIICGAPNVAVWAAGPGGHPGRRPPRGTQDQARQAARHRIPRHDLFRGGIRPGGDLGWHSPPAG
jgi:phenylalanyl-tRNA synthetase beta chain